MKKVALYLLVCTLVFPFVTQAQTPFMAKNETQAEQVTQQLPNFSFFQLDESGDTFTPQDLPVGQKLMIFYYDPYCEDCQHEAKSVNAALSQFDDIALLWISDMDVPVLQEFKATYFTNQKSDLFFAHDKNFKFDSYFGYSEFPSVFLYDEYRNLVTKFSEPTEVKDILAGYGSE